MAMTEQEMDEGTEFEVKTEAGWRVMRLRFPVGDMPLPPELADGVKLRGEAAQYATVRFVLSSAWQMIEGTRAALSPAALGATADGLGKLFETTLRGIRSADRIFDQLHKLGERHLAKKSS